MFRRLLKPIALLLVGGLLCSQTLYAFSAVPLILGTPSFNSSITTNPSLINHQTQKSLYSRELAQYGVQRLGEIAGLDPRLSGLIGAPISGLVGVGLDPMSRVTSKPASQGHFKTGQGQFDF